MGSLFTKIFLAFWLTFVLLGVAFFSAQQLFGDNRLVEAGQRLEAHAETVAALLADGGRAAVQRWLDGMRHSERQRLLLLDSQGRPLGGRHRHPSGSAPPLFRPEPGIQPLRSGRLGVLRAVPQSEPPLYLAAIVDGHRLQRLPLAARIGIALLITALVALGLAYLLTRPIRRLRRAAQALADGDLDITVGYRGRDEVAALARDFDLMAARIRDLLTSQRQLLSDVSHELRSPLARLQVALELAQRDGDCDTALQRIAREAEMLELLVGDVLSLSRLESGHAELQRQAVALDTLLQGIVQDADYEARSRQRRVELSACVPLRLSGEAVLLRAAIENVVRNAVRHTEAGSAVTVALQQQGGFAVVTVRDHGPGVPEHELERLFEPFARIEQARDRGHGGYGLGLAITSRVIKAHGGAVSAANHPGGGLEVVLRLPAPLSAK